MDTEKTIKVSKGYGYWDLSFYPWGGDFKRFQADYELTIKRVISTYNNGAPRQVIAMLDNKEIGIQL